MLLAVLALLLLAAVAARGVSAVPYADRALRLRPAPTTTTPPVTGTPPPPNQTLTNAYGATSAVLIVLVVVAALLGLAFALLFAARAARWGRRARGVAATPAPAVEDSTGDTGTALLRGARSGLAELAARVGGPPSDAVVAAWLHLERAAAEGGSARQPHQTPTEFALALLAGHAVDRTSLDLLRRLYQRARFGVGVDVTEADADVARRALERVAADLTATGSAAGSGR